jgi:uncharacterized protein YqfB (UPF0267 family)
MQNKINKPIFVVGSPRSGTSVLTWCLGQHPNIVALPESGWMGDVAIDLAIRYQIGSARGIRSILSAMDIQSDEFFASFGQTVNDLILRHRKDLERKRRVVSPPGAHRAPSFSKTSHSKSQPRARWVDGTPEYSFYICGLRKLFPKARFIHIVRDVPSVVRSMLNFHRIAGNRLVANEEQAYDYWLRAVSACLKAEQAYGPRVVFRLRYSELVDAPETAMRSVLKFVGERYVTASLKPLQERINSSNVPADFKIGDPETDSALVERATQLSTEMTETPQPSEASPAAAEEMEAAFYERARYVATVDSEYHRAKQIIATLQKEHAQQEASYYAELRRMQAEHAQQEASYRAELQRMQAEYAQHEASYHAERQRHERSIAELTDRLRRQLWDIRRLSRLLDDAENAAARLRSSRRWKLANPGTAIQAKLFPGKVSLGYGHLEKIVAAYSQWRASHPEIAKIEDATKGARPSILPSNAQGNSDKKVEDFPEIQSVRKIAISETSAEPE